MMKLDSKVVTAVALLVLVAGAASADVTVTERGRVEHKLEPGKHPERNSILFKDATFPDATGLEYFVNSDVTSITAESASGSVSDATYTAAVAASTSLGGTTMSTLSDAFDGYNGICLAASAGLGECDQFNPANFTVYNGNGPATLSCGGSELTFAPQMIGNLQVSRRTFVPSTDEFIRFLTLLTNTGGATETVHVLTSNNLGSDGDTEIFATSSGDLVVTTADTWIGSFQAFSGGTSTDPRLGHVVQGPGAAAPVSSVSFSDGQNQPFWEYDFDIAPGDTAIILNFATAQPNKPDVISKAQELVGLPESALECMTDQERSQVVNFVVAAAPGVLAVPTASHYGLASLALLLLVTGALVIRRLQA